MATSQKLLQKILGAMSHVKITEGRARILFPSSNEVFYNPVQEFNRDLRFKLCSWRLHGNFYHSLFNSIAVIKRYSEQLWSPGHKKKRIKPVNEKAGEEKNVRRDVSSGSSDEVMNH